MSAAAHPAHHGAELLREHLLRGGGEPAAHLRVLAPGNEQEPPGPPQLAAAGPRAAADRDGYELALELVLEGHRLHYGTPRVLAPGDPELALLLGDRLYAEGLALLTELGDLDAIAELADVIALCAQAHAAGDPALADAAWLACGAAVGFGAGAEHRDAQAAARAGDPAAASGLRAAARVTIAGAPGAA